MIMEIDYELWEKTQDVCVKMVRRFLKLNNKNSVKCNSILCVINNAMQDIRLSLESNKKSSAELCFLIRNIDVIVTGILDINNLLLGIGLKKKKMQLRDVLQIKRLYVDSEL